MRVQFGSLPSTFQLPGGPVATREDDMAVNPAVRPEPTTEEWATLSAPSAGLGMWLAYFAAAWLVCAIFTLLAAIFPYSF